MRLWILVCCFLGSALSQDRWHWTWECISSKGACIRSSQPVQYSDNTKYDTYGLCRLACGPYRSFWPKPKTIEYMSKEVVPIKLSGLSYDFKTKSSEVKEYLNEVKNIFENNIQKECGKKCNIDEGLDLIVSVQISNDNTVPGPDMDESYSIDIKTNELNVKVIIVAVSVFGARHGLETLSQLVAQYKLPNHETGLAMISTAIIKDTPKYGYRGLLLDTGRNYLPVSAIKRQMDAMAASKMNVLHWHATDSQNFPLDLPKVPLMAKYGAYSSKQTYNKSVIADLHTYAKYRGIRIILEIDAPSHAGNGWQWGPSENLGQLTVCVNQQPWRQYCIQPPCGQINPSNRNVFQVLKNLYTDLKDVTTYGEYVHMGGDEVFLQCWNSTDEIVQYMQGKGWGRSTEDFLNLWAEYQENARNVVDEVGMSTNGKTILWSSQLTDPGHIEKYLSKDKYIVQTWVPASDELPQKLLDKGYQLIVSTKDTWYLDHGFWGITEYHNWRVAYKNKLLNHPGVLGGEVCMWGELVEEGSLDSRVWPRAAAAGERLWSDPVWDTIDVEARMYTHRDRLVRRGIEADMLAPRWCVQNDGECK